LDDDFDIGEHKDGFYKYSQEMLEEKNRKFKPPMKRASDYAEVYDMRTSSTVRVTYMRGSDSTEASYASAVSGRDILSRQLPNRFREKKLRQSQQIPPIEIPTLPYTIGSSEWRSFAAREQLLDNPYSGATAEKFGSVISIFSKVYTIAKILAWALRMYGVEVSRERAETFQ
jgi:hypothetical protein